MKEREVFHLQAPGLIEHRGREQLIEPNRPRAIGRNEPTQRLGDAVLFDPEHTEGAQLDGQTHRLIQIHLANLLRAGPRGRVGRVMAELRRPMPCMRRVLGATLTTLIGALRLAPIEAQCLEQLIELRTFRKRRCLGVALRDKGLHLRGRETALEHAGSVFEGFFGTQCAWIELQTRAQGSLGTRVGSEAEQARITHGKQARERVGGLQVGLGLDRFELCPQAACSL